MEPRGRDFLVTDEAPTPGFGLAADVERLGATLQDADAESEYEQIVVAYNGSPASRAALRRAALVAASECTITVVNVIPAEAAQEPGLQGSQHGWQQRCLAEALALLRRDGHDAFVEAAVGDPAAVIAETARAGSGSGRDRLRPPRDRA